LKYVFGQEAMSSAGPQISLAHSDADVDRNIEVAHSFFAELCA
jgi:hypothetical protein